MVTEEMNFLVDTTIMFVEGLENMSYFPLPLRELVSKILINFDLPVAAEKIKVCQSTGRAAFSWINGSKSLRR